MLQFADIGLGSFLIARVGTQCANVALWGL